jgi:hypothetical protein
VDRFTDGINDPLSVALEADDQGGVVVGIEADEGTDLVNGAGPGCVVARFDASGLPRFAYTLAGADCTRSFGFAAEKTGQSAIVAALPDDAVAPGFLVVRLNPAGAVLSTRTIPGDVTQSRVGAAALQVDGTLLVGGYGIGTLDFGDGPRKLDPTGSLWLATYDPSFRLKSIFTVADSGFEMQARADPSGLGFVVTGDIDRSGVDLGGGALPFGGGSGAENRHIFLAKWTTTLGHVFSHSYGDSTAQDTTGLCLDEDGTIGWVGIAGGETTFGNGQFLSGSPGSSRDGFLATISSDGDARSAVPTQALVRGIGCAQDAYVLVGRIPDAPVDLGAGIVPPGGFVVRRARP